MLLVQQRIVENGILVGSHGMFSLHKNFELFKNTHASTVQSRDGVVFLVLHSSGSSDAGRCFVVVTPDRRLAVMPRETFRFRFTVDSQDD